MRFIRPVRPVKKVYIHISASDNPDHDNVATIDAWHKARGWAGVGYHFFIRKSGQIERGRDLEKTPAAQRPFNRGTIAICISGLKIDKVTKAELASLVDLCWQINDAYGGQITFHGHREVANKACPVIDYKKILGISEKGFLAGKRPKGIDIKTPDDVSATDPHQAPEMSVTSLQFGQRGLQVEVLQRQLVRLGYQVGTIDSNFGNRTRAAVLAFQADNHLITDGIVGSATMEAFDDALPRQIGDTRQTASLATLAEGGSRIADASIKNIAAGGTTTVALLTGVTAEFSDTFQNLKSQIEPIAEPFGGTTTFMLIALLAVVGFMTWQSIRAGRARTQDHRTGKTS